MTSRLFYWGPIMSQYTNTFVKLIGDLLQNIVIPSLIRWPYSMLLKFYPHIGNTGTYLHTFIFPTYSSVLNVFHKNI